MDKQRDEKGRFVAGHNGNPGGRPKGLAVLARVVTHDGADLVTFYATIFNDTKAKLEQRMAAADWLADRGWGRPVQQVSGDPDAPLVQIYLPERGPIV